MSEFNSLASFAAHLASLAVTEAVALNKGLVKVAELIEESAKDEIGFYQPSVGSFQEWEQLADSTEAEKTRLGFEPDAPLLRTGDLRDSYSHEVTGLEAIIGSSSDIAVWQEMGTERIPPRAVLGPAAIHNKERAERILGAATVAGLLGGALISSELGYDFNL